jgi:hypothetical protein
MLSSARSHLWYVPSGFGQGLFLIVLLIGAVMAAVVFCVWLVALLPIASASELLSLAANYPPATLTSPPINAWPKLRFIERRHMCSPRDDRVNLFEIIRRKIHIERTQIVFELL